ncbi:GDP-mannose 4,6 dehydratase [Devosia lucknowensis]|uniref:GDP-mannose 4,6 dehydratase n=1 Tax=Devosia lucknowensis TaxID=1096929 RepID=A0A1Y6FH81_9HYPH|nr:GDP-mannose 4,6 dehydratase [Devosia lucknowensis]
MRVLVTGGAGFIGSALVRHLIRDKGDTVLTVDKLTYAGSLRSLRDIAGRPEHTFVLADICDRCAMDNIFASFRPDKVVHLAAESHVDRSISDAEDFMRTNVMGTYSLLEAARTYYDNLSRHDQERFRFLHAISRS